MIWKYLRLAPFFYQALIDAEAAEVVNRATPKVSRHISPEFQVPTIIAQPNSESSFT